MSAYRSLIGCLRYLLHTRPDLSYSVGLLSRFMQEPREQHMKAIRQVLRYVKGTKDYGITYKHNGGNKIHGFSDSSYGVNTQEGKGTTGIIFYYGESPISWSTQKQATVALSSCESEFIAATAAATQALWLKRLLSKLTHSEEEKVTIRVDNKSAIALMKNPVFHGRSKHIDTKYHFIRECVEREDIQVEFVSGEYQKADILTKALPKIKFLTMRQLIGLKDLQLSGLQLLNLSNNEFSAVIPSSMGSLTQLESLDLSSNTLEGRMPQELVQLNFLEVLNVSYNNLTGPIPQARLESDFPVELIGFVILSGLDSRSGEGDKNSSEVAGRSISCIFTSNIDEPVEHYLLRTLCSRQSWIFSTLTPSLRKRLVDLNPTTAKDAWTYIEAIFQTNKALQSIVSVLNGLGSPISNDDVVTFALEGLPSTYETISTVIVSREPRSWVKCSNISTPSPPVAYTVSVPPGFQSVSGLNYLRSPTLCSSTVIAWFLLGLSIYGKAGLFPQGVQYLLGVTTAGVHLLSTGRGFQTLSGHRRGVHLDFITRRVLLRCDSTGELYPSDSISCNKEKLPVLCHACQLGNHVSSSFVSSSNSGDFVVLTCSLGFVGPVSNVEGDFGHWVTAISSILTSDWLYSDADWVRCSDYSEPTLSRSSAEAEYRGGSMLLQESWIRNLSS
ncbi:ribonuclease H-like domain, reverse transcriptase, RNA-dependent DNA polymerase [Tanacetum coccineum]